MCRLCNRDSPRYRIPAGGRTALGGACTAVQACSSPDTCQPAPHPSLAHPQQTSQPAAVPAAYTLGISVSLCTNDMPLHCLSSVANAIQACAGVGQVCAGLSCPAWPMHTHCGSVCRAILPRPANAYTHLLWLPHSPHCTLDASHLAHV